VESPKTDCRGQGFRERKSYLTEDRTNAKRGNFRVQPLQAEVTTKEKQKLAQLEVLEDKDYVGARIGIFYHKLPKRQKRRFDRVCTTICRKMKIEFAKNPLEMLLIRQVAMNTIRIEQAELDLLEGKYAKYTSDIEKWLFLAQKERRDAMAGLILLYKSGDKKSGTSKFGDLRDELRDEQGLEKSKEVELSPDGHDRRSYDDITRTAK